MRYQLQLPAGGPLLEIELGFWTGRTAVLADGRPLNKAPQGRRVFDLPMPEGRTGTIRLRSGGLDYVPKLVVNEVEYQLARPLRWYEYVLGGLPLCLLFGGFFGALFGLLATTLNLRIFRANCPALVKGIAVLGSTVCALLAYLVAAGFFSILLRR